MNTKKLSVLISACFITSVFAATTLTPNINNSSGNIPSGNQDLVFELSDGNWTKYLSLPSTASNNDKITIKSSAGYASVLDTSNTDFTINSLDIIEGTSISFIFDKTASVWKAFPQTRFGSKQNGSNIPNTTASTFEYYIEPDSAVTNVRFPTTPKDSQVLIIRSNNNQAAQIDTSDILFPSTFKMLKGDVYYFKYNAELKKWYVIGSPTRIINVNQLSNGTLSTLTAPRTEVKFWDGNWAKDLYLPATAADRDRVIVTSGATWQATISNVNINTKATLKLNRGDRYEFVYIADKNTWALVSSPLASLQVKDLSGGVIPQQKTPVIKVFAANGNWTSNVSLPTSAQNDDKVIVESQAEWAFNVNATGLSVPVKNGEKVRFVYKDGKWQQDSYVLDVLFVNSPKVSEVLGETAAKMRMYEGLRLTNEGLENSNAQLYARPVGYLVHRIQGTTLGDVLSFGRSDQVVQNERQRVGADSVYVQTDHEGCGLAYVNRGPNSFNMIGSEHYGCGINAMRHELGHNFGITHSLSWTDTLTRASGDYNEGYPHPLGGTIVNGNAIPFYSSPNLYHPVYGYALGVNGLVDGVRVINENAKPMSLFLASK